MQLLDRLFKLKKRHQPNGPNDNSIKSTDSNSTASSSTLCHGSFKRFSSLRHWRSTSKSLSHSQLPLDQLQQQQQLQQNLLTQCIETALYVSPSNNNKRWSSGDAPASKKNISFYEQEPSPPPPQPRVRKLSLPPLPTNTGYLASIPEVDSQITLNKMSPSLNSNSIII